MAVPNSETRLILVRLTELAQELLEIKQSISGNKSTGESGLIDLLSQCNQCDLRARENQDMIRIALWLALLQAFALVVIVAVLIFKP